MNTYIDCTPQIPEEKQTKDFHKNAWISPSGKFYEVWEGWLRKQGWCSVKNLAWLGDSKPSTFRCQELTQNQKAILFDYCEYFGYSWKEITGE